jgi:hypothetical protein
MATIAAHRARISQPRRRLLSDENKNSLFVDWVDFELVPGKFLLSELTGSGNNQEELAR